MSRRGLTAPLLVVIALVGAGCGGGAASDASSETSIIETESTSGAAVEALGVRCAELDGIATTFAQSIAGQTGTFDDVSFLLSEIAHAVPAEIEKDYRVVAGAFDRIAEALADVDYAFGTTQSPKDLQKLRELRASLDVAGVQAAARNIEAWATRNC